MTSYAPTMPHEGPALRSARLDIIDQLAAVRAELTRMSDVLAEANDNYNNYTMIFHRAKEQVDSAWRSVRYAVETVERR